MPPNNAISAGLTPPLSLTRNVRDLRVEVAVPREYLNRGAQNSFSLIRSHHSRCSFSTLAGLHCELRLLSIYSLSPRHKDDPGGKIWEKSGSGLGLTRTLKRKSMKLEARAEAV